MGGLIHGLAIRWLICYFLGRTLCALRPMEKSVDRLFDAIFMRCPPAVHRDVLGDGGTSGVNFELLSVQSHAYLNVLLSADLNVILLPPFIFTSEGPIYNPFVQDAAVVGRSHTLITGVLGDREACMAGSGFAFSFSHLPFRHTVSRIGPPASLEGGDVLITPEKAFVGISQRTNEDGIAQFRNAFPNITVIAVPVDENEVHLMCHASYLTGKDIMACPHFIDVGCFDDFNLIEVPKDEAGAANILYLGDRCVLMAAGYPQTREILVQRRYNPVEVDISEFQKLNGSISCLSLPIYRHF